MDILVGQRRAAINVEYILLMICAALAVTLGVSVLSNAMMLKHVQVAEALSAKQVDDQQVASTFAGVEATATDNGDGTYSFVANGSGVPPYTLTRDGVEVATGNSPSFVVTSPANGTYVVIDSRRQESNPIVLSLPIAHIVIDGVVADWSPVLAQPAGYVDDLTVAAGDNDVVTVPARDLTSGAAYADDTYLYLYWRRSAVAAMNLTSIAYLDVDNDGRIESGVDRIFVVTTNSVYNVTLIALYRPAATDVAIGGTGVSCPTALGTEVVGAGVLADMTADGYALEARVSWASLGVSPRHRTLVKFTTSNGTNIPSAISDNTNTLVTGDVLP